MDKYVHDLHEIHREMIGQNPKKIYMTLRREKQPIMFTHIYHGDDVAPAFA